MNSKRMFLVLTWTFALGLLLGACSDSNESASSEEDTAEQVFNMNIKTEPPTLHPGNTSDITSRTVVDQMFEGLMRINQDGEPEEAMAENMDVSDDGQTYTFTIREDATWTNGDPVTAWDFEYAWKLALEPDNQEADNAYQLYPIQGAEDAKENGASADDIGIKVEDDKTLVVELQQATEYFPDLTALPVFYPLNKNIAEKNDDWHLDAGEDYVTNGPFQLDAWNSNEKIVLKKNEKYWDASTVKLETVNMHMIGEEPTEMEMYEQDQLDWAGDPAGALPFAAIPTMRNTDELEISDRIGTFYYAFNHEHTPFDNVNIRKAFALAIDREAIAKYIAQGEQQPAMAFVPPSIFEENEQGYFESTDFDLARKYLKKGLEELELETLPTIKIAYNTAEGQEQFARAIGDMWKQNLYADVEVNNEDWDVHLDILNEGDYQVGRMGWDADFNDAISFLGVFETAGGNNKTNWEDEQYQDLLEASRTELDEEKRKELLKEAEQLLIDDMVIAPIFFETNVYMHKPKVHGIEVSSLGVIQLKWGYIAEE